MSTIEKIEVQGRSNIGSTASRRLRAEGIVPANLFGHKQDSVAIQLCGEVAHTLIKDGAKVVDLEMDGKLEKALLKEVQWDTFSKHIMHMDFLRVDPNERVTVEVPVVLRGTSPGVLAGGILEQQLHHVEVECLVVAVPDSITVRIGKLNIGDSIHVGDMAEVPRGVTVTTPSDAVVVTIAQEAPAPDAGEAEEDESTEE